MVPSDQLAAVETVLRSSQVSYWTDSDAISLDGKPAIAVINLGRGADVSRVQQLPAGRRMMIDSGLKVIAPHGGV